MRFLIRKCLRRDWLCADERVRGGCSDDHGPEGSCPQCPLHRLDAEMRGPVGAVIEQAFRLTRRKQAGFLLTADSLPADVVAAVEILWEEQQDVMEEKRGRDDEAESVRRELAKARR